MKYTQHVLLAVFCIVLSFAACVHAGPPPTLSLSTTGTSVQVIVSGTDANANVSFHYTSGSSDKSVDIGTTNSSGYLTATINPTTYGLSMGVPVYVVVNGSHSSNMAWPSGSGSSQPATLYLSQSNVNITVGQSATINASNVSGALSVPGNTNPSAVNSSVNGNVITVNGVSAGTAALTICDSSSGCTTVNVNVQPTGLAGQGVTFSQTTVNAGVSQNQTIAIYGYGAGPYYVSSNSNPNVISTAISGSNLIVTGLQNGNANVTVCASGGQCNNLYVIVSGSGSTVSGPLALASFNVSFSGSSLGTTGNILSMNFTASQSITAAQVIVDRSNILVNGSGSGPYTASYTVSGSERQPIPITVSITNSSGQSNQSYFWVGNTVNAAPVSNTASVISAVPTPSPSPLPTPSVNPIPSPTPHPQESVSAVSFTKYLYAGMTPAGVSDPEVAALQARLKKAGLFSGPVSGYFGLQTKIAVEAYQKKHGLKAIGVVGPSTRALLNQGL